MPYTQERSAITFFDDLLAKPAPPPIEDRAIDLFDSLLNASPKQKQKPEPSNAENRLVEASAEIEARSDPLFQDAPTDVSKLRRLNQVRREKALPPIEQLPQPRGAEMSDLLDVENIPFAGDVIAGKRLYDVLRSAGRAEDGKATDEDMENLADFQDQIVDEMRGRTFGGTVAAGVVDSAKFASELLATFGVGGAVKKVAVEGGEAVAKTVAKKSLTKLVKTIVKRSVKQSLLLQTQVFPKVIRNLMPQFGFDPKQLGNDVRFHIIEPGKSIGSALLNAELDNFIEILSENTGEVIAVFAKPISKLANKVTGGKLPKVQVKLSEFMRRAGISTGIAGTVGELTEERIGDVLREISTRLGADLGKPVSQDLKDLSEGKFGRLAKKYGTEAAVIGVFQGGSMAGSATLDRIPPRKQKQAPASPKQPVKVVEPVVEKKAPAASKSSTKPTPDLLSVEGVDNFVKSSPEAAQKVADMADQDTVSRKQLADASGIVQKDMNAEQRKQFVDRVKEATGKPKPVELKESAKQPWEMTRREFIDKGPDGVPLQGRSKTDLKLLADTKANPDKYLFHATPTADSAQSIEREGLVAGGLSGFPATDFAESPDGFILVFKRSDFPKGVNLNDVSLVDAPTVKPIGVFLASEYGGHIGGGARSQELGDMPEPPGIIHEAIVREAVKAGKIVPLEVLKDYPELAAKRPEEETIRLYRAESPTTSFSDIFNEEGLKSFAPPNGVKGKFYTPDREYAEYFQQSLGKDAVIKHIDVPLSVAEKGKQNPTEYFIDAADELAASETQTPNPSYLPENKTKAKQPEAVEVKDDTEGKSQTKVEPPKTVDQVVETMFPEAEKLQRQTREAPGGLAAIPKMFRPGMSADRNDDGADYWPSQEVSRRVEKARGIKRDTFTSKLVGFAQESWAKITRAQEFLPKNGEFTSANEGIRLLKGVPQYVVDQFIRRVGSVVNAMSKPDMNLFSDKVIIDNQLASVERGEPLRFGFESLEQVEQTQQRINERVANAPAVQDALESRNRLNRELVEKLVANGDIPDTALNNVETYFHQQVMAYVAGETLFASKTGIRQSKKSFQKARVKGETLAESFDYNTSFIEAEARWQVDALTKIKSNQIAKDFFKDIYDVKDTLKERAKNKNWENLVGGPANVARIEELRGLLAMARDKQIELDKEEGQLISEELDDLDPTRPFRKRIAIGMKKVRGDMDIDEIDFKMISDLAYTDVEEGHPDFDRAIGARMVLKAVNERAQFIKDSLGSKFLDWSDLIPEGHVVWQPEPGNVFYSAYSIPQKIGELLEKEALDSAQLTKEQLRTVLAMGAPRTQWVIPERVAKQLDKLERKLEVGLVGRMAKSTMRGWKIYTLLNPLNALPYMGRNATGDVDPVLGGAPGIAFEVKDATKDLWGVYKKEIDIPRDVAEAIEYNVIGSSMTDVEIPDLKENDIFRRFYDTKFDPAGAPWRAVELYFKTVKGFNEYRENVLRLAAYRYYKKKLESKTLTHYGGARKVVVDTLVEQQGVDVAAAHLSRQLLGDYGDITVLGEWLRTRMIPFWSWQEINIKRYQRLAINSIQAKKLGAASGAVAMGIYRGLMLSRMAAMYAAYWAYNNLAQPDKENDLDTWDRQNPHVNLCRNLDGSVRIFRNVGAMGDFLEWFGINSLMSLMPKYLDEQITGSDLLIEVLKEPTNKLAQGVGPHFKLAVEVPLGVSLFPDIWNPRTQDRGEAIAAAMSLRDEYKAVRGKILKDGSRARPHYIQRAFFGVVDPKLTALNKIHELRGDFLAKKGKDVPTILSSSKFKNMKLAAAYENFDAFLEARKKYMSDGKGFENFMASLNKLDPVSARLNDAEEEEFEQKFLNGTQKLDLKVARDYARTLEVYLWHWWLEASKVQDTPEQQNQLRKDIIKFKKNLKQRTKSRNAERQRGEPLSKFKQRRQSKIKSANEAREKLKRLSQP